jgi:hypothetical protein
VGDQNRTSRQIEREVEQERAELQGTLEELFNRFTFEEAWNRVGAYMRDNRGEFGQSFGRVVKEKPLAVALTAVGVGWLLFGPSQQAARPSESDRRTRSHRYRRDDHEKTREMLEEAEFADRSARGPAGADAQPDPWEAPSRTTTDAAQPTMETFGKGDTTSATKPSQEPTGLGAVDGQDTTTNLTSSVLQGTGGVTSPAATTSPPVSGAPSAAVKEGSKSEAPAGAGRKRDDEQRSPSSTVNGTSGKQIP